jgi:hypothetical protein
MKRLVLAVPALVMLILAAPLTPAFGQAGGIDMKALDRLAEDHKQVPLTEDIINRFVASYPEMKAVGAKFPQTEATEDKASEDGDDELASMPPEKRKAMEEVATKHGFKDLEEWMTVASTLAMSYAHLREGKSRQDLQTMIDRAVTQAENNPKLTQEQREKAIAQYREIGDKLAKLQPLPANIELVEKMIGKVAPVMKIQ